MTDEEIAKWYVVNCDIKMNKKCPKEKMTCFDCILQWLKSETMISNYTDEIGISRQKVG